MASIPSDAAFGVLTVHEALAKDAGYTSTLKQMRIMHEKSLIRRSERCRSHVYETGFTGEETRAWLAGDLMHRVFEGPAGNLVLDACEKRRKSR